MWNSRAAAAKNGASVASVLLELDKSHEYFMHAAAGVPADRFQPGKTAWTLMDGNSADDYREYADQIPRVTKVARSVGTRNYVDRKTRGRKARVRVLIAAEPRR